MLMGNSVVTDVQFGHLFLVCIKYDALQEVTCGLFRKREREEKTFLFKVEQNGKYNTSEFAITSTSHCSYYI